MTDQPFNRNTPPGFRGLHPDLPITTYQRHLPHWRQEGATYFVTFRLADSIPQPQQQALKRWRQIWESSHPEPRSESDWQGLARQITRQTEARLDEGYGNCELARPEIIKLVHDSLLKFQDDRYFIACFVVLPNHVHALMKPLNCHDLEVILKNMKGYVSRQTNRILQRAGMLWAEETYDRIVRDEAHLYRVVQYIGRNLAKAGLSRTNYNCWIDPRWQSVGWDFERS